MAKTILIVGGTGMLGKPVALKLQDAGFRINIFSRNAEKSKQIFPDSFKIVQGKTDDLESIKRAIDGCYGIHLNLNNEFEHQAAANFSKAAKQAGIKQISYISGATVCAENRWFPMIDSKFKAEQEVIHSGINYCIFRPTWFMESLPRFVQAGKAVVFGKQPHQYHWIAAIDYANMVAISYQKPEAQNKIFYIHGTQAYTMHEALTKYCAVLNPKITKITTIPYWLVGLIATLKGNKELKFAKTLMAYFEKAGEIGVPSKTSEILGTPQISLDEWIKMRKKGMNLF